MCALFFNTSIVEGQKSKHFSLELVFTIYSIYICKNKQEQHLLKLFTENKVGMNIHLNCNIYFLFFYHYIQIPKYKIDFYSI